MRHNAGHSKWYICVMAALKKTQRNVHLLVKSPFQNFPLVLSVFKFGYFEKATKFEKIFYLKFDAT